jgi:hypothetical protein
MSRSNGRSAAAAATPAAQDLPRNELYAYQVRREGRIVARLRALGAADGSVIVETEVHPVNTPPGESAIARPFEFPDADYARRFVDEALLALEYLNCEVVE